MNPKNILNLLKLAFKGPEYNIESEITDGERSFASNLVEIIKTSSDCKLLVESYNTLSYYDESVTPEAVVVDENVDEEYIESIENDDPSGVTLDIISKGQLRFGVQAREKGEVWNLYRPNLQK